MFDSLDDQVKHDQQEGKTTKERLVQILAVVFFSILIFGGLFYAVGKFSEF